MLENRKKESVVVGLTGRMDSAVAAYLLKNQGLNVIGLALQFYSGERILKSKDEHETREILLDPIKSDCHIEDLNEVKTLCETLEIPLYIVAAEKIFEEKIIEYVVSAKLEGGTFAPCIYCNQVKLDLLLEKTEKLGADFMATGHYAKIHWEAKNNEYHVYSSKDIKSDQSYLLGNLKQKHLEKLILPLAEMRVSEVEKISSLINYKFKNNFRKKRMCFMEDKKISTLVEARSAESLRKEGSIFKWEDNSFVVEHSGIHNHHIGQEIKGSEKNSFDLEMKISKMKVSTQNIYIERSDKLYFEICSLIYFYSDGNLDKSLPKVAYVKFGIWGELKRVTVYFKNNNRVVLSFDERQNGILTPGQQAVLYNKKIGGRIFGTGQVDRVSMSDQIARVKDSREDQQKNIFSLDNEQEDEMIRPEFDF